MLQCAFGNPAYFVKEFSNFHFQLTSTLLNPRDHIRLDARAVHIHQIIQKRLSVMLDHRKKLESRRGIHPQDIAMEMRAVQRGLALQT